MKIAICGIGAVGGYFGGLLAKHYQHSPDTEIYFIARGENEKEIRKSGLKVFSTKGDYTAYPKMTTSDAASIGAVDLLICCTKSFHLEESLVQCAACIHPGTIILPLLNGVDSQRIISAIYPSNEVYDGCVYLVARLTEPGVVRETGHISKLFFGSENGTNAKQQDILDLFKTAGIETILPDNIQQVMWEKFVFISSLATLTSYLDESVGSILSDTNKTDLLHSLLKEIIMVAEKKQIPLSEDILQVTLNKFSSLPYNTTSSMHSDFKKENSTEIESLTGYVVRTSKEYNTAVPVFEMMYEKLKSKLE